MPCQTFSRLCAPRQLLQTRTMKHRSPTVWSERASLILISPLWFLRGDTRTRPYVSCMLTSSLYLVSGETCVCEAGVTHAATMLSLVYMNQQHRLRTQTQIKFHIRFNFPQTLVWSTANRDDCSDTDSSMAVCTWLRFRLLCFHPTAALMRNVQFSPAIQIPQCKNNSSSCIQLH